MQIHSEMTGTIMKTAAAGTSVAPGDTIVIIESMKMEIPVEAEHPGTLTKIHVKEGDTVEDGTLLADLDPTTP